MPKLPRTSPRAAARPTRSDAKFADAADLLRRDIVHGIWQPGERLPTWDALCERLDIQRPTLRRTLSILKAEGFIESAPTRATCVHAAPPHLTRYALLFPSSPQRHGPSGWNLFWDALSIQAPVLAHELGIHIDIHYDVTAHPDCAAYVDTLDNIAKRRLAGVLIAHGGDLLDLFATKPDDATVVHIGAGDIARSAPNICLDWDSFHSRATDLLLARGCRRIAILAESSTNAALAAAALAERGISVPPKWTLAIPGYLPELASNPVRLLVSNPADRPDALFITDDNLVPPALEGIHSESLSIPGDILALGHYNHPEPPHPAGVISLGFPARDVLQAALNFCAPSTRRARPPYPSIAIKPANENGK